MEMNHRVDGGPTSLWNRGEEMRCFHKATAVSVGFRGGTNRRSVTSSFEVRTGVHITQADIFDAGVKI